MLRHGLVSLSFKGSETRRKGWTSGVLLQDWATNILLKDYHLDMLTSTNTWDLQESLSCPEETLSIPRCPMTSCSSGGKEQGQLEALKQQPQHQSQSKKLSPLVGERITGVSN